MDKRTVMGAIMGCGLFVAGWAAGQTPGTPMLVTPAMAQGAPKPFDPDVLAALFGVASIAVDIDATTIRLNELTDRVAVMERRLVRLEHPGK
jgi:hypothetical protein